MLVNQKKTFRVLVIDDLVCKGREGLSPSEVQNVISNYLFCLAKAKDPDCWVEICYVATPEEGVARWTQEVFDLTLVDSNFKVKEHVKNDDSWKRSFLDVNIEFTGAYLFRFFLEMLKINKEYGDYRKGCKIALWTGLKHDKDPDRAKKLLGLLAEAGGTVWFVPKDEEQELVRWEGESQELSRRQEGGGGEAKRISVLTLKECVDHCFSEDTNLSTNLARLVSLYKTQTPEAFAYLVGLGANWIEHGYLVARDEQIVLEDDLSKIGKDDLFVELSPMLRRADMAFKSVIKKVSNAEHSAEDRLVDSTVSGYLAYDVTTKDFLSVPTSNKERIANSSGLVAAATPLTGCSAVGRVRAVGLMVRKVKALLDGPFEKVVLKTVYLDSMEQWKDVQWPHIQAQSQHRTRCLRSAEYPRTLWNTGVTALESFMPDMMNECLKKIDLQKRGQVIVSLGSKFPQCAVSGKCLQYDQCLRDPKGVNRSQCRLHSYRIFSDFSANVADEFKRDLTEVWSALFGSVFAGVGEKDYPLVEINVRHYLRECVAYHLGGNEYLSPVKVDGRFSGCYDALDREFNTWIEVLCDVAKKHKKRLLFKLPFRGDDFHWIHLIYNKSKSDSSIAGITLINAFKSGVCESQVSAMYSPAWYGRQDAWGDALDKEWKYQMSGEMLTASRNELLGEVLKLARENPKFEVHLSGGIIRGKDIRECRKIYYDKEGCLKCNPCKVTNGCPGKAFVCGHDIDADKCRQCGACISLCVNKKVFRAVPFVQVGTWPLLDLNLGEPKWIQCMNIAPTIGVGRPQVDGLKCKKCVSCYVHCEKGAFEQKSGAVAHINLSKCIDCKRCLSECPHGAVVVERPERVRLRGKVEDGKRKIGLKHRIAFWLHELCNGCGRCSRTFYCDTFLDRRGLDLPPVMDFRNCTGCGLCVQTCPRGAIQMFDPRHVVILIASTVALLSVWRIRLSAHEIPHLVYTEDQIKDAYMQLLGETGAESSTLSQWLKIVMVGKNEFLKDSVVLKTEDVDRCTCFDPGTRRHSKSLMIEQIEALPCVVSIREEVDRRLAHLRM